MVLAPPGPNHVTDLLLPREGHDLVAEGIRFPVRVLRDVTDQLVFRPPVLGLTVDSYRD